MDMSDIARHARALYDAHGDSAEAEAAKQAQRAKSFGDTATATEWQRIRSAIRELRGASVS
ncbi:hypothetical protein HKCCE2091_20510 [Rhodobacterales bacterium HKCCE2091]|nr:hypothetical protein [Rhodobacterales bacterium HKCCE2091]